MQQVLVFFPGGISGRGVQVPTHLYIRQILHERPKRGVWNAFMLKLVGAVLLLLSALLAWTGKSYLTLGWVSAGLGMTHCRGKLNMKHFELLPLRSFSLPSRPLPYPPPPLPLLHLVFPCCLSPRAPFPVLLSFQMHSVCCHLFCPFWTNSTGLSSRLTVPTSYVYSLKCFHSSWTPTHF